MTDTSHSYTRLAQMTAGFSIGRAVLIFILVSGFTAFFVFDLNQYVSLAALKKHRATLQFLVDNYGVLVAAILMVVYALAVAFSVPGAVFITIASGFMFGPYFGTLYAVIGATIGALGVFLAAKYVLGDVLLAKAGPLVKRMEVGFRKNEMSYLLVLRLVPIFPFWVVNLVAALVGVRLRTYAIGTLLGIIPGTFVYASVGDGASGVLDAGGELNLGIIFEPSSLVPIIGLALLACIPIVYKTLKRRLDFPSN